MIWDSLLLLSGSVGANGSAQPELYSAVGATASINAIDNELDAPSTPYTQQAQARDFGDGQPTPVNLRVTQAPIGGGSSLAFELVAADDADFQTRLVRLARTADFTPEQLPFGAQVRMAINPQLDAARRYLGLRCVIAGSALTTPIGLFGGIGIHEETINRIFNTRWTVA